MFSSIAHAAGNSGMVPAEGIGGQLSMFMPLILMVVVFYFLLIRPQQKRQKTHKEMLTKLQRSDYVITTGGLLGRIVEINGDILSIDLGDSQVRVPRSYITSTYDPKQMDSTLDAAPNTQK